MRIRWVKAIAIALLIGSIASDPRAAPQTRTAPPEASWPATITADGATATIYEPQAISWPDHKTLNARAAIAIMRRGAQSPILGTIEVAVTTDTDLNTRSVIVSDPKLLSSRFPSLDTDQAAQVEQRIKAALGGIAAKRVPLDTVLLSLKEAPQGKVKQPVLNNDPPMIFTSTRPASLVVFDGEPVLAPVHGTTLSFAVNTNWDVFVDPADHTWYLLNNGIWLAAPGYSGPYAPVTKLPPAFNTLPNDANFAEVRKNLPPHPVKSADVPTIFVSTKPAEIIVTAGAPSFAPIPGTALQYVTNTGSDVFLDTTTGRFYYLVSGRWFSSVGLSGPWVFATPDLPADFARIPPDSPRGHVLASVPGTPQAQLAVLQAQIPHQATLKRSEAKLNVTYVGTPRFEPITGTDMSYAVNTSFDVIGIGGKYYACYQGVWFVSPSPTGPWALADSIPAAIHTIPPSNPLYNVTYVTVYGATPQTVTYGYTAGYLMGFVTAGVLAYGTGYYYPPVVVPGPVPAYLPYPYSYAGGVYYNSATGTWARGGTVYGPYGAATGGAAYNPATGAYARGAAVYGPYGGAGAWSAYNPTTGAYAHGSAAWGPNGGTAYGNFYNPRTGISGSTTQNANPYARWGSSVVSGPNATVHTASGSNAQGSAGGFRSSTGAAGAGVHGAGGNNAGVVKGGGGNVYAGADGNVYRHTSDGWSKYENGSWQPVEHNSTSSPRPQGTQAGTGTARQGRWNGGEFGGASYQQLEQDRQARERGQFRSGYGGMGGRERFRR
jgi:hypothetical protein